MNSSSRTGWLKNLFIGKARSLADQSLFHKVSLVAVLAWVGLGADGLSSSRTQRWRRSSRWRAW
jgi:hypothetical protein